MGQQAHVGWRLTQPVGSFVAAEHGGKELTVVSRLEDSPPLVVGRDPDPVRLPAMKIGQTLGPDFIWCAACAYGCSKSELELVKDILRAKIAAQRMDATARELESITLSDSPLLERGFGNDDSEGIADGPNDELHADVITVITSHASWGPTRGQIACKTVE